MVKVRLIEPGEQLWESSVGENARTLTKSFAVTSHSQIRVLQVFGLSVDFVRRGIDCPSN
jgi:hypothetical protein